MIFRWETAASWFALIKTIGLLVSGFAALLPKLVLVAGAMFKFAAAQVAAMGPAAAIVAGITALGTGLAYLVGIPVEKWLYDNSAAWRAMADAIANAINEAAEFFGINLSGVDTTETDAILKRNQAKLAKIRAAGAGPRSLQPGGVAAAKTGMTEGEKAIVAAIENMPNKQKQLNGINA